MTATPPIPTTNRQRILDAAVRNLRDIATDIEIVKNVEAPEPRFDPSVSAVLVDFATTNGLTNGDVAMLSGIHYRGTTPTTESDYWYIWQSIVRTLRG